MDFLISPTNDSYSQNDWPGHGYVLRFLIIIRDTPKPTFKCSLTQTVRKKGMGLNHMDDLVMDYREQYDVVSLKMESRDLKSLPIFVIYPRVELEN